MKRSLKDQVALITGGSAGIGLEIAHALAAEGMSLVLAARSRDNLDKAQRELSTYDVRVIGIPTDVTRPDQLQALVEQAHQTFGRIDVLINNAGIETYRDFHALSLEDIDATIRINLTSAIQLSRLVVPGMLQNKRGHIINLSSTAGKHGPAFGAAYGASKAGLLSLSQSLRAEYHRSGIHSTAICPGFTHEGGMYERMKSETGKQTPWYVGSTTTDQVAKVVVRALRSSAPEYVVNWPPLRPVFALASFFPRLGGWLIQKATFRFLRRVAQSRALPGTACEGADSKKSAA